MVLSIARHTTVVCEEKDEVMTNTIIFSFPSILLIPVTYPRAAEKL